MQVEFGAPKPGGSFLFFTRSQETLRDRYVKSEIFSLKSYKLMLTILIKRNHFVLVFLHLVSVVCKHLVEHVISMLLPLGGRLKKKN